MNITENEDSRSLRTVCVCAHMCMCVRVHVSKPQTHGSGEIPPHSCCSEPRPGVWAAWTLWGLLAVTLHVGGGGNMSGRPDPACAEGWRCQSHGVACQLRHPPWTCVGHALHTAGTK